MSHICPSFDVSRRMGSSVSVDKAFRKQKHIRLSASRRTRKVSLRTVSGSSNDIRGNPVFHLAFPVNDLEEARDFYGKKHLNNLLRKLKLPEGRSSASWVDFNLYGHQIVCHVIPNYNAASSQNSVDGDPVPVPHFGLAMSEVQFQEVLIL
eukprot:CAMPEP_0177578062 /NCGR_PEP_ID=MMETSP0419_2-20121207/127_1 /TAXON_ID=582737 /ORGANISM="Tetraselmis sp., Strain GSL018" /LENGTH=150 /DNA_ID=CAMNT_0019066439 /DNA_START=104 /DNA_END=557 /DNA_ORIENTATION=-